MADKPTDLPDWDTGDTNSVEPTSGLKTAGIPTGSIIARQTLNWLYQTIGKWMRYLNENVADKNNNLSDLPDIPTARTNLGVESQTQAEAKYFQINNNLNEASASDIRTQVDVYSKSEADTRYINETYLSTDAETQTGVATDKVVTPASLSSRTATTTRTGLVEKATTTEAVGGTANKFVDAATMQHALLNPTDVTAKREALGEYTGFVDYTTASINASTLPAGWSVVYNSGGNITVTHNLGVDVHTVVTDSGTGKIRYARAVNDNTNSITISTATSDGYLAANTAVVFFTRVV